MMTTLMTRLEQIHLWAETTVDVNELEILNVFQFVFMSLWYISLSWILLQSKMSPADITYHRNTDAFPIIYSINKSVFDVISCRRTKASF